MGKSDEECCCCGGLSCCCCCGGSKAEADLQDELAEGNTHDFSHSPLLQERVCRDGFWALLFCMFWVGMLVVAAFAVSRGNPARLLHGADSFGNLCGQDNVRVINNTNSGLDLRGRDYLYYFDPGNDEALQLCVPKCPDEETLCSSCEDGSCACRQVYDACLNSTDGTYSINADTRSRYRGNFGCPSKLFETANLLGIGRCVPSLYETVAEKTYADRLFAQLDAEETIQSIFADVYRSRRKIAACCILAAVFACVFVLLMRVLAGPIIWTTVILAVAAIVTLTAFLWIQYKDMHDDLNAVPKEERFATDERNAKAMLGLAVAVTAVAVVLLLVLVALIKRIRFVVAVFTEASKVLWRMPQVMLIPLITLALLAALFFYWIAVYLFLATSGTPTEHPKTGYVEYKTHDWYQRMWWYHLLGLLWGALFLQGCEDLIIASCTATWYFTRDKTRIRLPVCTALGNALRFHLGSVALGSLLLALVKLLRWIMTYIQKRFENSTTKCALFLLKCCTCCLWCFEKFLKFLTKDAYVEIAIFGYSFCTGAREAFKVLLANIVRVAAINSVGRFCLFLIKLAAVCLTGAVAVWWLKDDSSLHFYGVVVAGICVFAYFIAAVFVNVYVMVIESIMICFCEDHARHDGVNKPYFMTDRLARLLSREERRDRREGERRYLLADNKPGPDYGSQPANAGV